MSKIHESPIQKLRPTQMTVGMIEVNDKKKHLRSLKANEQRDYMRAHPIPAVVGAKGLLFITDHHHLCRAALEARVATGFFEVEADFSNCDLATFWPEMDKKRWVHPLDKYGTRHYYSAIPPRLDKLIERLSIPGGVCQKLRRIREDAYSLRGIRLGRFFPALHSG